MKSTYTEVDALRDTLDIDEAIDIARGYTQTGGFIYLASPYSDPDPQVREQRCQDVQEIAAIFLRAGVPVHCPIAQNHFIAIRHGLPGGWDFWEQVDAPLVACSCLFVAVLLAGWEQSRGLLAEVAIAQAEGIPIVSVLLRTERPTSSRRR